mmetsp:Transcript_58850/g.125012  ORF Transcript_58850/g.125012 Transcript_58850/m.125012 type:complete len:85 (+) Transcript_58850:793-1047(+)
MAPGLVGTPASHLAPRHGGPHSSSGSPTTVAAAAAAATTNNAAFAEVDAPERPSVRTGRRPEGGREIPGRRRPDGGGWRQQGGV